MYFVYNLCTKLFYTHSVFNFCMYQTYPNPNPNGRCLIDCKGCGRRVPHEAKGYCKTCYKKYCWKPKRIICKNCGREENFHALGLCHNCYLRLHNYDPIKAYNAKKYYGIDYQLFKQVTTECVSCGFSKIVDLHHLDGNKRNNDRNNLIGLCPNCHKMIHMYNYFDEIRLNLEKKGYDLSRYKPALLFSERKRLKEENAKKSRN